MVDLGEKKEVEAVQRLLDLQPLSEAFIGSLGVFPSFSWYVLQLRKDRLIRAKDFEGDIDILAGKLEWRDARVVESVHKEIARSHPNVPKGFLNYFAASKVAGNSGILWPPPLSHLAGVEAKCSYLSSDAHQITEENMKSKKSSESKVHHLRAQVDNLLKMGLDTVALLDIIANPPASGVNGGAWITALSIAISSLEAMMPTLRNRLPESLPASHWVWSLGAVGGGDETMRGAGAPIELKRGAVNPLLQRDRGVQAKRRIVEVMLHEIFTQMPPPISLPVVLVDCRACNKIHGVNEDCTR